MVAQRGDVTQIINVRKLANGDTKFPKRQHMALLGSKSHLIAFVYGRIHVFRVGSEPLLTHASCTPMTSNLDGLQPSLPVGACWQSDDSGNTILACSCESGVISIWELNPMTDQVEHVQTFIDDGATDETVFQSIVLTKLYVVGSMHETKRAKVFDRRTGKLLHSLCDAKNTTNEAECTEYTSRSLSMQGVGDLLVTSSTYGNARVFGTCELDCFCRKWRMRLTK